MALAESVVGSRVRSHGKNHQYHIETAQGVYLATQRLPGGGPSRTARKHWKSREIGQEAHRGTKRTFRGADLLSIGGSFDYPLISMHERCGWPLPI